MGTPSRPPPSTSSTLALSSCLQTPWVYSTALVEMPWGCHAQKSALSQWGPPVMSGLCTLQTGEGERAHLGRALAPCFRQQNERDSAWNRRGLHGREASWEQWRLARQQRYQKAGLHNLASLSPSQGRSTGLLHV